MLLVTMMTFVIINPDDTVLLYMKNWCKLWTHFICHPLSLQPHIHCLAWGQVSPNEIIILFHPGCLFAVVLCPLGWGISCTICVSFLHSWTILWITTPALAQPNYCSEYYLKFVIYHRHNHANPKFTNIWWRWSHSTFWPFYEIFSS